MVLFFIFIIYILFYVSKLKLYFDFNSFESTKSPETEEQRLW